MRARRGAGAERRRCCTARRRRVVVRENGLRFTVAPGAGQKTGHFCDQRPNRALLRAARRRPPRARRLRLHAAASPSMPAPAAPRRSSPSTARRARSPRPSATGRSTTCAGDASRFVDRDVAPLPARERRAFDLLVLDPPALVKQRKDLAARRARLQGSASLGAAPRRAGRAAADLHLLAARRRRAVPQDRRRRRRRRRPRRCHPRTPRSRPGPPRRARPSRRADTLHGLLLRVT